MKAPLTLPGSRHSRRSLGLLLLAVLLATHLNLAAPAQPVAANQLTPESMIALVEHNANAFFGNWVDRSPYGSWYQAPKIVLFNTPQRQGRYNSSCRPITGTLSYCGPGPYYGPCDT